MAESNFERTWNDWHLEILSTADLACHIFDEILGLDCPDWMKSAAFICRQRLVDETQNAPVPPFHA